MKHLMLFISILFLSAYLFPVSAQENIADREGNVYKTICVGEQVWMAENLKATRFLNGDPIPCVKADKQWKEMKSSAYCDLHNDPEISKINGRLYNWYSASDPRKICPSGWHVPTDTEWMILITYLTGENAPGIVIPERKEINQVVFGHLSGEFRGFDGEFSHIGYGGGGWWSITPCTEKTAFYRNVTYNTAGKIRMEGLKYYGYHIRCVKD